MPQNMLDGDQVIVDYLIREKVPYHHETVAGFMADAYYRVSGQPTATFTSVCDRIGRLDARHLKKLDSFNDLASH